MYPQTRWTGSALRQDLVFRLGRRCGGETGSREAWHVRQPRPRTAVGDPRTHVRTVVQRLYATFTTVWWNAPRRTDCSQRCARLLPRASTVLGEEQRFGNDGVFQLLEVDALVRSVDPSQRILRTHTQYF